MVRIGDAFAGMRPISNDSLFLNPQNSAFFPRPMSSSGKFDVTRRPGTQPDMGARAGSVPNLHARGAPGLHQDFGNRPPSRGGTGSFVERPPSRGAGSGFMDRFGLGPGGGGGGDFWQGERPPSRGGSGAGGGFYGERPASRGGGAGAFGGGRPASRGGSSGAGASLARGPRQMGLGATEPPPGAPLLFAKDDNPTSPPPGGGGRRADDPFAEKSSLGRPQSAADLTRLVPDEETTLLLQRGQGGRLNNPRDLVNSASIGDLGGVVPVQRRPKSSDGLGRRAAVRQQPTSAVEGGGPPRQAFFQPPSADVSRRPQSSPAGAARPKNRPADVAGGAASVAADADQFEAGWPPPLQEDSNLGKRDDGHWQRGGDVAAPVQRMWEPAPVSDWAYEEGGLPELLPPAGRREEAKSFDGAGGVADVMRGQPPEDRPQTSPAGGGGGVKLRRSASTREARFAEKEKWRIAADIPTPDDFPHGYCVGWDAMRATGPPQYSFNPVRHTCDKFQANPKKRNAMEQTRCANRYTRPTEASIKDAERFNRVKGVCEYVDIMRPTNERLNRAYHRGLHKNEKVFRRASGANTCFVDMMIRQGDKVYRPGTRIRT